MPDMVFRKTKTPFIQPDKNKDTSNRAYVRTASSRESPLSCNLQRKNEDAHEKFQDAGFKPNPKPFQGGGGHET